MFAFWLGNASRCYANSFEDTIRILENRTSFHWGQDCLVWVVHYPEELVDPWVDSEAVRTGMTESERRSYKEGFISGLSIGEAEPFLFTVYAFGPRPLNFSPLSEKIALVTAEGKRVKPIRYDRTLDQPLSGLVQGLVFFPKQNEGDFALAVQGMGVYDERIFAFSDNSLDNSLDNSEVLFANENSENSGNPEDLLDVVIVELPPASGQRAPQEPPFAPKPVSTTKRASNRNPRPATPKQPEASVSLVEPSTEITTETTTETTQPTKNVATEPEIIVMEPEESQSMEDFVEALRSRGNQEPLSEEAKTQETEADKAYSSREKTVRAFLELWMKHDPDAMYSMLSKSSQKLFSKETFESELRKASDFRGALRDGYTIDWTGVERAKIVAVKRILLIRTLISRTLGVVREESNWKIVW
ncbi:MAG: hypothetical protein LBJ36_02850 [Synergistaceae bacterium]|nr:hypothetical protein [Synergistaceae bacterium]